MYGSAAVSGGGMFVPLFYRPGQAYCRLGVGRAVTGRMDFKAQCFVLDMPYYNGCFAEAYPSATSETFSDGHIFVFAFQGARL